MAAGRRTGHSLAFGEGNASAKCLSSFLCQRKAHRNPSSNGVHIGGSVFEQRSQKQPQVLLWEGLSKRRAGEMHFHVFLTEDSGWWLRPGS